MIKKAIKPSIPIAKGNATNLTLLFAIIAPFGEPRSRAIHEQSSAIGKKIAASKDRPIITTGSPIGLTLVSGISIVAAVHNVDTQMKHM